ASEGICPGRQPAGRLFVSAVAAGSTSARSSGAVSAGAETRLASQNLAASLWEIQAQWPAFHLMEQPIGGRKVVGGSLWARRASRTSRITCFRTAFGS